MLGFRYLWEEKANFESLMYTGSRATTSSSNDFLEEISDSLVNFQRLYN